MHSPTTALTWEVWQRNRLSFLLVVGLLVFAWVFNAAFSDSLRATAAARERLLALDWLMTVGSMLLLFGGFNYTEFSPGKDWSGFPYRLFALPVRTWQLVALPMFLGAAAVQLNFLAWMKLVFAHDAPPNAGWFGFLLGLFMLFYQAALWSLAAFRILRVVLLGFAGVCFVGIACLPFSAGLGPSLWFSEKVLVPLLALMALPVFAIAWAVVGRQRAGGGRRKQWIKSLAEWMIDLLPRRRADFANPPAAQFWFEWRRSGWLLPAVIAALLLIMIAPLSWCWRSSAVLSLWVLMWALAMPIIIAAAMGKGFSKPDFWSGNLALPSFVAARPMAAGEMVAVKMKVAALSVVLSWVLVLGFLSLWLPLWANLDSLTTLRAGYWMVQGHSVLPQYVMAALSVLAGMLVMWKFLVGGLWLGLSGSRKWYLGSMAVYCGGGILALIGMTVLLRNDAAFRESLRKDPNQLLTVFEWIVATIVIGKFWLAAFSWRGIGRRRVGQYLLLWAGSTLVLIALANLLWAGGLLSLVLTDLADVLPLDPPRLQCFMILIALAAVPLARIGLAPSSLAKNRRGGGGGEHLAVSKPFLALAALMSVAAVALAAGGQTYIRVDAGGPELWMLMTGSGGPTVVFEAGAGGPLESWVRVQPEVSRFTRAISYDRAGDGLSTKGPTPRDGQHVAHELHTALRNAQAPPPYILVGHSLGGPYIRIFAGLFPQEVAGMVLVDPTQEELIEWAEARNPKPKHDPKPYDEVDCAPATFAQARASRVPAGIPVILISGMGPREIPGFAAATFRETAARDQKIFYPAKLKFHREWLEKIPNGKLIITEKSGHGIPFEEPELVVSAVRQIVEQVRRGQ